MFFGVLGRGSEVILVCHDNLLPSGKVVFLYQGPSFLKASFFYELVTVTTSILCIHADICLLGCMVYYHNDEIKLQFLSKSICFYIRVYFDYYYFFKFGIGGDFD